jgi:hypothetical protein
MMKKITLLLILLTVSFGYSQSSPITFEADVTVGVNWNNATGITTSIVDVANTSISGVVNTPANPAGMVGKMMTDSGANPWQEAHLIMTTFGIDLTTLNGGAKTVTVDVYSTTGNDFLLKVINPVGGGGDFSQVAAAHDGTGWEQLTFNFNNATNSAVPDALFTTFVFFPLYDAVAVNFIDSADTTTAIDNISFVEGSLDAPPSCSDNIQNQDETDIDCGGTICDPCPPPAAPPTVAAPTPPARNSEDVVSIYSDAYTPISPINYDAAWCGANAVTATTAGGDAVFAYNDKACQGIDFASDLQDVTGLTNIHVDLFIQAGTDLIGKVFNMKIVPTTGAVTEFNIDLNALNPAPVTGEWYSYDAAVTLSGTTTDIKEFGVTSNLQNAVWYDNLYLYREFFEPGTCSDGVMNQDETGVDCGGTISGCVPCTGPPTTAAPTPPPRDPADVISIYSDAYTDITTDSFDFGLCGANPSVSEVMIEGNATQQYLGEGCQGINFETNRQDASTFTNLHFDFFTDLSGDDLIGKVFNIKLVDWAGNATEAGATGLEVNFNDGTSPGIIASSWVSVDVDITSFGAMVGGNLTRSDIAQIHITSNLPNAWYDNLYLHKNTTLGIENNELVDFNIYPNPTQENWTVKTKSESMSSIKVYDILGKQVLSLSPNSIEATINGTSLNSGLYFAQIKTDSGLSNIKLIKN